MENEVLFEVNHLKKYFPTQEKGKAVKAVDDVSFQVLQLSLIHIYPARPNVLARLGPAGGADPLVLISHIDVVDADEARWSHPPFSCLLYTSRCV